MTAQLRDEGEETTYVQPFGGQELRLPVFVTHQEDDVGVLVESSGHADSLPLTSAQVNALKDKQQTLIVKSQSLVLSSNSNSDVLKLTRSPISV